MAGSLADSDCSDVMSFFWKKQLCKMTLNICSSLQSTLSTLITKSVFLDRFHIWTKYITACLARSALWLSALSLACLSVCLSSSASSIRPLRSFTWQIKGKCHKIIYMKASQARPALWLSALSLACLSVCLSSSASSIRPLSSFTWQLKGKYHKIIYITAMLA